jgi:exosortase
MNLYPENEGKSSKEVKMTDSKKLLYFQIGIVFIFFAGLYYPFIWTMIQDWDQNANYSHGYLIPFISVYMVYSLRKELQHLEISANNWGLPIILLGLAQLLVAKIGSEYFLQRTSIIIVIFGLSLFLLGKPITKKVSIPILYLIFMIPIPAIIWNRIAFPLQLFASAITEHVIHFIGIPVFREGNILHIAETSLEVVDACSGIRSLVTLLALSAAFAFLSGLPKYRRLILFVSAAPIAIFVNIVRLTITAVLSNRFGEKMAQGFLHEASGFVIFFLGLALLYSVLTILSKGIRAHAKN